MVVAAFLGLFGGGVASSSEEDDVDDVDEIDDGEEGDLVDDGLIVKCWVGLGVRADLRTGVPTLLELLVISSSDFFLPR